MSLSDTFIEIVLVPVKFMKLIVSLLFNGFFIFHIYLFIFGCAESSLQLTGFLELWCVQTSHCGGFCCCEAPALGHASLVAL